MLLDHCLDNAPFVRLDSEGLSWARDHALDLPAGPGAVLAVASSPLRQAAALDGRSAVGARHLDLSARQVAAEEARLVAKGQALYEHCLDVDSAVCVLGFVEYELGKDPRFAFTGLLLLDWMVDVAPGVAAAPLPGQIETARRLVHGAAALLHGLDGDAALALEDDG